MRTTTPHLIDSIAQAGFVVLEQAFHSALVDEILQELEAALAAPVDANESVRSQDGGVYAARNVLTLWPRAAEVWRQQALLDALHSVLGRAFGLVRVLFFDKPPERTWSLPWHKDLTIAVREHRASPRFGKPTRKAGIPHVEAPIEVLEQMLIGRLHLDDVNDENGPLKVIPGSHRSGKELVLDASPPISIHAQRGDVLLMRPLLAHCSNKSREGTSRHRRILHFEFASTANLPDDFRWHDFIPAQ